MIKTMKDFYEEYWKYREKIGKIHTLDNKKIPKRLEIVLSMISNNKKLIRVLDLGCGEGILGKLLMKSIDNLYSVGCDISEKSIAFASPHYNEVIQLDVENDDLKTKVGNNTFEYIVCVEVLEHLIKPEAVLSQCKDLLSSDGCLIVSFPNIAWWKYRLLLLKGYFPEKSRLYHHAEHLHDFTMSTFTKLLLDSGFKIIDMDGDFKPPSIFYHILPNNYFNKFMKKHPNLFGYQIVMKVKPI